MFNQANRLLKSIFKGTNFLLRIMNKISITIEVNCDNCHHRSHSGAFTKGGAKPMCHHPDVENHAKIIPYKTDWTNTRPIRVPKKLPEWCPLKEGKTYL